MEENETESVEQLLQKADWKRILKELLAFSGYKFPYYQVEFRKELVQETIKKVLVGEQKWNPQKRPSLLNHLKLVFISVASNEIRSVRNRKKIALHAYSENDKEDSLINIPLNDKSIEKTIEDRDIIERVYNVVQGEDIAESVLLYIDEGVTSPKEIAKESGVDIKEIYNALRRIRYKASKLEK